jgi:hypothetical protein
MVSMGNGNDDEHFLPIRREGVVVEELDGEALVYDPECGAVHRFNGVVMFVWSGCDGVRTVGEIIEEMTERYAIDHSEAGEQVGRVIEDFQRLGLLDDEEPGQRPKETAMPDAQHVEVDEADGASISRRRMIRGGVGMLVFAPPAISTFFAKGAFAAASNPINPNFSATCGGGNANPGYSCTTDQDCCDLDSSSSTTCETSDRFVCCIKINRGTCYSDTDCCNGNTCNAGICEN